MLFGSPADRNEFIDPPPADQSVATLVLGQERLNCRLVEVSVGGFTVIVPRATLWTGEPIARLVTNSTVFKVRILKQEAQYEGYQVVLQRIDETTLQRLASPQHWVILLSRSCAIGLILAIGYCIGFVPGGASRANSRPFTMQSIMSFWFDPWISSDPPVVATSTPKVINETPTITVSLDDSEDEPFTRPVSSYTHESGDDENSTVGESKADRRTPAVADRRLLLRAALATADLDRSRPVNSETLPWLFPQQDQPATGIPGCRMSRPAEADLRTFSNCLTSLPTAAADQAVQNLQGTLRSIPGGLSTPLEGIPQVQSIQGADAEVYFRKLDGEIELLRILPIEFQDPVPARSPSARRNSHSAHR